MFPSDSPVFKTELAIIQILCLPMVSSPNASSLCFLRCYKARSFYSVRFHHSPQQLPFSFLFPLSASKILSLRAKMESNTTSVLSELAQVHELARKLSENLQQPSQTEHSRTIAEEIVFYIEKAICTVKSTGGNESQLSHSGGQYSGNQQMLKKRKMLPTWTCHVSAKTLRGSESLPDDGYTWRKYGQKDILKAKYPRAYYRCTHSKKQGCPAMKQVQISDDNPSVFEVTYRGSHTCSSMVQPQDPHQSPLDQQNNNRALDDLQNSLRVKTESLVFEIQDLTTSIFFPYTPLNHAEDLFCSSPNLESCFLTSFSSALMSPTTSESNCLPMSPRQKSGQGDPRADLTDIISMATSNSTMVDADFMLRTGEIDAYFPIEAFNSVEWNSAD